MITLTSTAPLRLLLLLGALSAAPAAWAQHATLAQCSRVIVADSVVLFFNARYELTPVGCAVIRRQTRMTAEGKAYGFAEDYRIINNQLMIRAKYEDGVLHGPYAAFYSNGQQALSGQYERGQRRGDWEYWYASGQPQQLVRFLPEGPSRIISYWDTTGRAQVTNGNGVWQGRATRGFWSSGRIRMGLPDGTWRGYSTRGKQKFHAIEQYELGRFRRAYWTDERQRQKQVYYEALLLPPTNAAVERAFPLHLGLSCDAQTQQQQFALLRENLVVPTVGMGVQHYSERLTQRMVRHTEDKWYEALPEKAKVRCSLDSTGRFTAFHSESRAFQLVVERMLTHSMPAWQPARFQGVPVPGYVDVELNTTTRVIKVRPAARLLPEQVPTVPLPDLL